MYPRRFMKFSCTYIPLSTPRQIACLVLFFLFICVSLFCIPLRNVVFRYYVYKAWEDVSTSDIIQMHYIRAPYPAGVFTKVECVTKTTPTLKRGDFNTTRLRTSKASHDKSLVFEALSRGHGRYLPFMTAEKKLDYLYLFEAMKEALRRRNIVFFMTAGSILGATRHGGFIPWDDDLDFGIHISDWEEVKQVLSCIEGFTLNIFGGVHWKFEIENRDFPFIDLFFYSQNGPYLWAMTRYISKTFIYPEDLVFPLVEVDFEGTLMPMPGQGLKIAHRIYDFSFCVAYQGHVEVNRSWTSVFPDGYSKDNVPCQDLLYMHRMTNLDCDCEDDVRS